MSYKYSFEDYDKENMSRSYGQNLKVSFKKSVETLKAVKRKKSIDKSIEFLENVILKTAPVPYTKFNKEMPHRRGKGIASGGFPKNVCEEILRILKNAKSSADSKNLELKKLKIISASARKGNTRMKPGRYHGRKMKATNIELVLGVNKK